jgi:hypothetical protein
LIPPYFGFRDVELLRQRLLVLRRTQDLGYLNWLIRAYSGALKKRRLTQFEPSKQKKPRDVRSFEQGKNNLNVD